MGDVDFGLLRTVSSPAAVSVRSKKDTREKYLSAERLERFGNSKRGLQRTEKTRIASLFQKKVAKSLNPTINLRLTPESSEDKNLESTMKNPTDDANYFEAKHLELKSPNISNSGDGEEDIDGDKDSVGSDSSSSSDEGKKVAIPLAQLTAVSTTKDYNKLIKFKV